MQWKHEGEKRGFFTPDVTTICQNIPCHRIFILLSGIYFQSAWLEGIPYLEEVTIYFSFTICKCIRKKKAKFVSYLNWNSRDCQIPGMSEKSNCNLLFSLSIKVANYPNNSEHILLSHGQI